jgi:hypothetical protein
LTGPDPSRTLVSKTVEPDATYMHIGSEGNDIMSKSKTTTVTLTEAEVREALGRGGPIEALDSAAERALRMRHGVGLAPDAPLGSKTAGHPEAAAALLEMEAALLGEARRRSAVEIRDTELESEETGPRPTDSRIKSKIVRALRKKS